VVGLSWTALLVESVAAQAFATPAEIRETSGVDGPLYPRQNCSETALVARSDKAKLYDTE
jgi:hypothetical protein